MEQLKLTEKDFSGHVYQRLTSIADEQKTHGARISIPICVFQKLLQVMDDTSTDRVTIHHPSGRQSYVVVKSIRGVDVRVDFYDELKEAHVD